MLWLDFFISSVLIIIAGLLLTKSGEQIAAKTRFSQLLIGIILLSLVTSLPELVTGSTAAVIAAPDLALGNVIGSNIFNLAILALIDVLEGPGPLMLKVSIQQIMPGFLMLIMSAIVGFFLVLYSVAGFSPSFWLGLESLFLVFAYILGLRLIYRYQNRSSDQDTSRASPLADLLTVTAGDAPDQEISKSALAPRNSITGFSWPDISLPAAYLVTLISAVVILLAGRNLIFTATEIAELTGLGHTFLGPVLLAAVTSLPEIVTSISAYKLGAFNLAVGNVLGSNLFNLLILVWLDFFHAGSLLAASEPANLLPLFSSILMTNLILLGLFYRSRASFLRLGWGAISLLVVYVVTIILLYLFNLPVPL